MTHIYLFLCEEGHLISKEYSFQICDIENVEFVFLNKEKIEFFF